jgi:hypothetical protein
MKGSGITNEGGMEGVPLQLIIVVVIGMAALGILVGWIALAGDSDPTLRRVTANPEIVEVEGEGRAVLETMVTVYVYDSEGNEVDGVVVTFSGALDERVTEIVDSGDGVSIMAALAPGQNTGIIEIEAEKGGGMGSCTSTVIVMRR